MGVEAQTRVVNHTCEERERPRPSDLAATIVVTALLGVMLRLMWILTQTPVIASDGAEYARMAEHLFHDHALIGNFEGPEILYAPLYSVLIAVSMLVIPNSEVAAHAISLLCGAALIVMVFMLADYIYGRRTAYICGILAATQPLLIALSASVYNEALYLTIWTSVVYCAVRALDQLRTRDCILLGICLGLAYLTRVEAFAYVPLAIAALLIAGLLRKKVRAAIVGSIVVCSIFAVLASPYIAFFYMSTGNLRLEAKSDISYTIARNRLAGMSDLEADYGIGQDLTIKGPLLAPFEFADHTPYPKPLAAKLSTVASMVKHNAQTVYHYLLQREIGSPVMLGLVVLALFRHTWSNRRLSHETVLLVMAGSIVLIVLASSTAEFRYFLPIVPLLLLWSGKGVKDLAQWIKGWELLRQHRWIPPNVIATALQLSVIGLMLLLSIEGVRRDWLFSAQRSAAAIAARDAGLWLAKHEPGPKRIAVMFPVVPYYAKGTLLCFPFGDSESTWRYLERRKVDFVVLESNKSEVVPTIGEWITHGVPDPYAQLVYDRTNSSGDRVVIYRRQARTML